MRKQLLNPRSSTANQSIRYEKRSGNDYGVIG